MIEVHGKSAAIVESSLLDPNLVGRWIERPELPAYQTEFLLFPGAI
jgi:hypothetical protein